MKPGARKRNGPSKRRRITSPWLNHCLREIVDADTIVISEYSFRQEYCPLDTPGQSVRPEFRRRAWLGVPGVTRGEAGVARQDGGFGAWRRRLHVRQSDRLSLRRANAKPARSDGHLQQRAVRRGAARDVGNVRTRASRPRRTDGCSPSFPGRRSKRSSRRMTVMARESNGPPIFPRRCGARPRRCAAVNRRLVNVVCQGDQ